MEHVRIEAVAELETNPASSLRRPIGDALGTTDVAVNHYELEPGDSLSGGLHAHHDQEEIFIVVGGEVTFDVGPDRDSVPVSAGEAIRFAPGEYQEGYNDHEEPAEVLALGAPPGTEDIDSYIPCRECEAETILAFHVEGETSVHTCLECGNELRFSLSD